MTRKEFIQKAKKVAKSIMHVNKYLVVLVLGVLLVGFFSDSSVVAHISNMNRMKELRAEIAQHKALTKANLDQIEVEITENEEKTNLPDADRHEGSGARGP